MPNKVLKSRYWEFLIYPNDENTTQFWFDCLINTHLKGVISPIHDKDIWTDFDIQKKKKYCEENNIVSGDLKKPHHHVLICFSNPTTENNILTILHDEGLDNITHVEKCNSVRGSYDYWIHLNNQDKHQYDSKDRISFNGFNINDYTELSSKETLEIKKYLIKLIKCNLISYFNDLVDYLIDNDLDDELAIVVSSGNFFNTYLKANLNKFEAMHLHDKISGLQ